jgi:hypothetical protein
MFTSQQQREELLEALKAHGCEPDEGTRKTALNAALLGAFNDAEDLRIALKLMKTALDARRDFLERDSLEAKDVAALRSDLRLAVDLLGEAEKVAEWIAKVSIEAVVPDCLPIDEVPKWR